MQQSFGWLHFEIVKRQQVGRYQTESNLLQISACGMGYDLDAGFRRRDGIAVLGVDLLCREARFSRDLGNLRHR